MFVREGANVSEQRRKRGRERVKASERECQSVRERGRKMVGEQDLPGCTGAPPDSFKTALSVMLIR
jgi:hypothetical protein